MPVYSLLVCAPTWSMLHPQHLVLDISMLWNISRLTALRNTLIYCTVILAFKMYAINCRNPSSFLFYSQIRSEPWKTSPAGTSYIGEVSENGQIEAGIMKNVEWKETKEVREVAHKSPSLNVTQKIRKTSWIRRWERPKDLASAWTPNYSFSYYFCHQWTLQQVCKRDFFTCKNTKEKIHQFHQGSCPDIHTNVSLQKITASNFSNSCHHFMPLKSWKVNCR